MKSRFAYIHASGRSIPEHPRASSPVTPPGRTGPAAGKLHLSSEFPECQPGKTCLAQGRFRPGPPVQPRVRSGNVQACLPDHSTPRMLAALRHILRPKLRASFPPAVQTAHARNVGETRDGSGSTLLRAVAFQPCVAKTTARRREIGRAHV